MPKSFAKFFLILLLSAALLPAAEEPSPTPKKDKTPSSKDSKVDESVGGDEQKIDIPVPPGVPARGVKIPYYGEDNKTLKMLFNADVATKLDDTHIEMQNLRIEIYGEDGKKSYIELPRSIFNMTTRMLDGQSRVTIKREDCEIFGDAMEFNTKTKFGKILGNVKMTIFNTDNYSLEQSKKK